VLGFGALQLSSDRDPNVPHAEAPPARALDLAGLLARGGLQRWPALLNQAPPRIAAADANSRAALGYLHANCSHCHNDAGPLASMGMPMRQSVVDPSASATRTWLSLYGETSRFRKERGDRDEQQQALRIAPGRVDDSTLLLRMMSPHAMSRMPPIGVSVIDAAGIQLIRQWILNNDVSNPKEPKP
jgi:mono/diheme cytochrome c family protein